MFIILIVYLVKMSVFTYDTVNTGHVKVDCKFRQGVCLTPINGECPPFDFSYKTIENTDCEAQDKVCCVKN